MSNADRPTPAISTVSDLETSGWSGRPGQPGEPSTEVTVEEAQGLDRPLPAPMHMRLKGGEIVTLTEMQVFADSAVIRPGERGKALYPSSQAAAWVVHFPRVGPKLRVIPEPLLEIAE